MINYILQYNKSIDRLVEIGSLIGESTTIFLGFDQIKRIDCIDRDSYFTDILNTKLEKYIKSNRCFIHNAYSNQCVNEFQNESIDVVYIDGDHSYDGVKNDITLYYPKLKIGGFLCGHDYSVPWPDVIRAVDEHSKEYNLDLHIFKDASWLMRKE